MYLLGFFDFRARGCGDARGAIDSLVWAGIQIGLGWNRASRVISRSGGGRFWLNYHFLVGCAIV